MFKFFCTQKRKVLIALILVILLMIPIIKYPSKIFAASLYPDISLHSTYNGVVHPGDELVFSVTDDEQVSYITYKFDSRHIGTGGAEYKGNVTEPFRAKVPEDMSNGVHEITVMARNSRDYVLQYTVSFYVIPKEQVIFSDTEKPKIGVSINSSTYVPVEEGNKVTVTITENATELYLFAYKWRLNNRDKDYSLDVTESYKPENVIKIDMPTTFGKWNLQMFARDGAYNPSKGTYAVYYMTFDTTELENLKEQFEAKKAEGIYSKSTLDEVEKAIREAENFVSKVNQDIVDRKI